MVQTAAFRRVTAGRAAASASRAAARHGGASGSIAGRILRAGTRSFVGTPVSLGPAPAPKALAARRSAKSGSSVRILATVASEKPEAASAVNTAGTVAHPGEGGLYTVDEENTFGYDGGVCEGESLTFTGDLAKKKIFPSLFALFYEGMLPERFTIFGYARSKFTDEEFREMIMESLTCRITHKENCDDRMGEFLDRCFYQAGGYDSMEGFGKLSEAMSVQEGRCTANRIFYLSVPPTVFVDASTCAAKAAKSPTGYTRVIVEKPFGRDADSSQELSEGLSQALTEEQIYRIDHYLGKELIENLLVLRFSNLVFEPLWSRQYIRSVQIIFSENFGTEGRGGYFDNYGIIRDIMQNHLLQVMALFAMEPPVSLGADDIRDEKVKVLRSMRQIEMSDVVVGQYKSRSSHGVTKPGYLDDETVPKGSITPTFAAACLHIDNARWDGVPFLMKAGKALENRRAEIRIQFRHVPGNLYRSRFHNIDLATNELVLRIQPDEEIYLKINNKIPGLGLRLDRSKLYLQYKQRYDRELPDAYERLILDVINGDKRLFIRSDELVAAWKLFTPLLHQLESERVQPELYPYGSRGPVGSHYLAAKYNARWGDLEE